MMRLLLKPLVAPTLPAPGALHAVTALLLRHADGSAFLNGSSWSELFSSRVMTVGNNVGSMPGKKFEFAKVTRASNVVEPPPEIVLTVDQLLVPNWSRA